MWLRFFRRYERAAASRFMQASELCLWHCEEQLMPSRLLTLLIMSLFLFNIILHPLWRRHSLLFFPLHPLTPFLPVPPSPRPSRLLSPQLQPPPSSNPRPRPTLSPSLLSLPDPLKSRVVKARCPVIKLVGLYHRGKTICISHPYFHLRSLASPHAHSLISSLFMLTHVTPIAAHL